MDLQRIGSSVDTDRTRHAHVTMVGGSSWLVEGLVRCGVAGVTLVDFDRYSATNIARQDAYHDDVGRLKVEVLAKRLRRVNPEVEVEVVPTDFCAMRREECDEYFGQTSLFIFATDQFAPQARGNIEALRLGRPAVWIGLYAQGRAGEIIYHVPGLTPACSRCVAVSRYKSARRGVASVPSDGATIFDLHLVDAVAGQVSLGILTRGASNRYGRLIEQLGNRNLLQVKIDPGYRLGERDIFREYLGSHPANFSFNTIAIPMAPEPGCHDCAHLRQEEEAACDRSPDAK
jgi:hypothetical protein